MISDKRYGRLDAASDVRKAWRDLDESKRTKDELRETFPTLARALDRLVDTHPKA